MRLHKQQQLDDNTTEIANHVFGDILTENPAVAQSAFGPHRVITDRWKGMSPNQLEDIRKQQDLQRTEKEVSWGQGVDMAEYHSILLLQYCISNIRYII